MDNVKFFPLGDCALSVEFGDSIDPDINSIVHRLHTRMSDSPPVGFLESVPTYRALMVCYRPELVGYAELVGVIRSLLCDIMEDTTPQKCEVVRIPVCYGGQHGPDLQTVSEHSGLSLDEVILRHTRPQYLIYMLGFTPGFPYLGGMDPALATPRLATPRMKIQAGSVGIAGEQTGIYPLSSPGGWQLIGRTPIQLIDAGHSPPTVLKPGQYIKFYAISPDEYEAISKGGGRR